jgi:hypothetical protein
MTRLWCLPSGFVDRVRFAFATQKQARMEAPCAKVLIARFRYHLEEEAFKLPVLLVAA